MSKQKLQLVKSHKDSKLYSKPNLHHLPERPQGLDPNLLLSPAEQAEVNRFRALTATRAAQKFMVRQIMAELDDISAVA